MRKALQTEQRPGVRNSLSHYSFLGLVAMPSPSLFFLDHVKIQDKPGKNSSIHKARKISLALLSPGKLDKYCTREPEKETQTTD